MNQLSSPILTTLFLDSLSYLAIALLVYIVYRATRYQEARESRVKKRVFKIKYLKASPMTNTELLFFRRLVEAVPNGVIGPQVSMSALVDVPAQLNQGKFKYANRSRFSLQRVDYVIFDKETGSVRSVIELDDYSHDTRQQQAKDADRDALLKGVGYKVFRFDARSMPNVRELYKILR